MKGLTLAVLIALSLAAMLPRAGWAQRYSIFDFGHRTTLTASTGYLYNSAEGGASEWRGIDVAPALTYSLAAPQAEGPWYPPLSLFVQYAHGFPFDDSDGHQNRLRAVLNLKVSPQPGIPSISPKLGLSLGGGLLWQGNESIQAWNGYEAHVTGTWDLPWEWLVAYATYSHGFASISGADQRDFNFAGLGVNARILALH